jgi:hypothetical protein
MKRTKATAEQAEFALRKGVTAVAAERKDTKNTIGKKKTVDLDRRTETSIEVDAPNATTDGRGRRYQEAFETVYDASERLTPMVERDFQGSPGCRIQPEGTWFNVDQDNQNVLPKLEDHLVPQGTIAELKRADKDYPGGHDEED